ncbi:MAG: hypothetical protein GY798_23885 [Hyphomicrobiales bacterium]|nr:hypothetical protein [Hyphomicrobiales bacterium]
MGTKYAVDHFLKAFNWDLQTRNFRLNPGPGKIEVVEFDYSKENEVVYDDNGVVIRSWPAIHAGDGAISYSLEWKGMKIVIGGDTFPNKWFIEYADDADVAIHEVFLTPDALVAWYGQSPEQAIGVGTQIHTSPPAFGKVMSTIQPRHAIGYHFFNEEATRYGIYDGVRETYSGPLSLATDNMVWNITKDEIVERMTVSPDEAWSVAGPTPPPAPLTSGVPDPLSEAMKDGKWLPEADDAQQDLVDEFKKEYDLE